MSNTRRAPEGSTLNQARFASSPDIERGLLGNLVAIKCGGVESPADRELLWWLQAGSHKSGWLHGIAEQVLKRYLSCHRDPLKEMKDDPVDTADAVFMAAGSEWDTVEQSEARTSYLAQAERRFLTSQRRQRWTETVNHLPELIAQFCLDASVPVSGGWPQPLPKLYSILRELKAESTAQAEKSFAHTALSRAVWRELSEAHEMGGTVLLHNSAGNGKSYSAKAYCEAHPGHARYVNTPATNDETGFLRAIAEALGVGAGLSFTALQMRPRILSVLRDGNIVLVIDSAQWLFPVSDYRYALPNRINWVLSALSEQGVPVVMIADTKLFDTLGFVEARTGWNRNKFVNQLSGIVELPSVLEKEDVQTVAAALLPDGDRAAQRKLADYMIVAQSYLHAGQPAAQRARRIAASHKRARVTLAAMTEVIDTRMVPAFKSMNSALERADAAKKRSKATVRNWRPDTDNQVAAKGGKRRNQIVTSSDFDREATPSAAIPQRFRSEAAGPLPRARIRALGTEPSNALVKV